MLVLRTSNYQTDSSKTQTLYCLNCSPLNFPVAACLKTENDKNLFIISNHYGTLRFYVFSVVSSSDDITPMHVETILYVNC